MANKIKDTDYLFSTARVRSVEKYMLTREQAEKMIDAKSSEDAIRILYECNYGYGKEQIAAKDYENLLKEEHKKAYDFIVSIAPEPNYFNIFRYIYDYHNMKVIMKSEYLGTEADAALVDTGSINLSIMKHAVKEREFSRLTENMSKALSEIIEQFPKNKDPQIIDVILDKFLYDEMIKSSQESGNKFIEEYVLLQIDMINLKTFVRLKKMGKSLNFFLKVFIDGGNVPEYIFIKNFEDFESLANELLVYGYKELFLEGLESFNETGMFTVLEKLFDNNVIEYVKSAKYISYGIEPLAAYLIAKENEIKIARIIIAGKLAALSSSLITERIRDTYV